jgi:hypothetical protein
MAVTPRRRVVRFELRGGSADDILSALADMFRASGLAHDERVQLLGGAFVTEALRPYWTDGVTPVQAHERLRVDDPELAARRAKTRLPPSTGSSSCSARSNNRHASQDRRSAGCRPGPREVPHCPAVGSGNFYTRSSVKAKGAARWLEQFGAAPSASGWFPSR